MNKTTADSPKLYILDVGHGNCTVLKTGKGVIVIDVGRRGSLLEFLLEQEITNIDTIYLSHADVDHIGALVGLLASRKVSIQNVVLNSDSLKETKAWYSLAYELNEAHNSGRTKSRVGMVSGDRLDFDDIEILVLGPSPNLAIRGVGGRDELGRRITTNSISCVLRVSVSGQHIAVLPGDIDSVGLDDLLDNVNKPELEASVLVYPHHGGSTGGENITEFAERILATISPAVVVFSIGRGQHRMPNPTTVHAVKRLVPQSRIVCTQLSEHCTASTPSESPRHLSPVFSQGRVNNTCCGGTIVIPLDCPSQIEPRDVDHMEFIKSYVENPLCLAFNSNYTMLTD